MEFSYFDAKKYKKELEYFAAVCTGYFRAGKPLYTMSDIYPLFSSPFLNEVLPEALLDVTKDTDFTIGGDVFNIKGFYVEELQVQLAMKNKEATKELFLTPKELIETLEGEKCKDTK